MGRAYDKLQPFVALSPVARTDLNTATAAELEQLPGVGPVLAARIVVDRDEHGPFDTLEALERVPGVGPALRLKVEPLVMVR